MKGKIMVNKIARAIYEARKNKSTIRANIRLKKNGQFSSVSGTVSEVKVSKDGEAYVIFKGKGKGSKEFQSVPLNNVLAVVKDDVVYKNG